MKDEHAVLLLCLVGLQPLCGCAFERTPASPFAADAGLHGFGADAYVTDATHSDTGMDTPQQDAGARSDRASPADGSAAGDHETAGAGGGGSAGGGGATRGTQQPGDGADAGVDEPRTAGEPSGAGCTQRVVTGCDPIANTGCPAALMQQCAVDLLATTPTGYCAFSSPPPTAGATCLNTGITESCPPRSTCFEGACRALCLCDDDCDQGQCCVDPIGNAGFKLCGDC